jgi:pseudouridine-5'-phosphate glycosidase
MMSVQGVKSQYLIVRPGVQEALDRGRPVVALESALITHGLPRPQNLETARRLEEVVREQEATPATVAVLKGRIQVGLTAEDLERLAENREARKVSRRDLALAVAKGWDGGTTVAATMWIAHQAGIQVFATGGIGGVHRPVASRQMSVARQTDEGLTTDYWVLATDISADLPELARTPVAVVCSGAKAILDLPLTLEWLETYGVPVLGYGTDELPAFTSRGSGLPVDLRVDSPEEAARVIRARWELGLEGGVLIAVPIPTADEIPREVMEAAIAQALTEAEAQGVGGKAVTPFLLAQISQITGGASLRANIALLENNAVVAVQIARALAEFPPG